MGKIDWTNPSEVKEYNRKKIANLRRKWKSENLEAFHQKMNRQAKVWRKNLKLEVLKHYSKSGRIECECCRENHLEFLTLDHLDSKGIEDRKIFKCPSAFYSFLRKNNYPRKLRILCFNCNISLGTYGYCPHELDKLTSKLKEGFKKVEVLENGKVKETIQDKQV